MDIKSLSVGMPSLGSGSSAPARMSKNWDDFGSMLADQIMETDRLQKESVELNQKAALGNAGVNLHEAQIAAARADVHLRFMMQVRNKAIDAYKEIINMPV